jgi:hypothetical protein
VNQERRKGRAVCRSDRRSIPSEWLLRPSDSNDSNDGGGGSGSDDDDDDDDMMMVMIVMRI